MNQCERCGLVVPTKPVYVRVPGRSSESVHLCHGCMAMELYLLGLSKSDTELAAWRGRLRQAVEVFTGGD